MFHSEPVRCQFFTDSYSFSSPVTEGYENFCFHLAGNHTVRIGSGIFDFDSPAAFLLPSTAELSLRGRGKVCLLSCGLTYLGSLLRTSAGASLSSVLPSAREGQFRAYSLSSHTALRIEPILHVIAEEAGLRRSDYLDMIHFRLYELLILLRREGPIGRDVLERWSSSNKHSNLGSIMEYIAANFDNSFSLEELASRAGLNPSYFSRLFREKAGIPLFEYINRLRIERAVLLLKNSSMTVLEIAVTVGYNNVSFFNRYFRKLKGCSPGEYRRKVKK